MVLLGLVGMVLNGALLYLLNERGEGGAGAAGSATEDVDKLFAQVKETMSKLPPEKIDRLFGGRFSEIKEQYRDYDDLRKFKIEHEKKVEEATQKELEAKKEYDKLKEGWSKKEQEFSGVISKKEAEIADMKIGNALMSEVNRQNAYAEETMALLKQQAAFDKDGNIRIKGRDANGLETMDSVEEGVKKFLTARPHLVKATKRDGGGTPPGAGGGQAKGGDDLNTLNQQLMSAQQRGDGKAIKELTVKVRAALAHQGTRY